MGFIEVQHRQDLRVGLYVKLEGSWFSHPFRTNTFKIKSLEDLETIKGLGKVRILYDPDRSEEDKLVEEQIQDEAEDASVDERNHTQEQKQHEEEPDPGLIGEAALSEIIERRHNYQDYQEHIRKVEGSYQKVLGQSSEIFNTVKKGQAKGLKMAEQIVSGIQGVLQHPQSAMSLIDVMGSNGTMWGLSEHALNVCMLSLLIGKQMDLTPQEFLSVGIGGLLHDIGYRSLPMKVRFLAAGMKVQPDPDMLFEHPMVGCQLIQSFPDVQPMVLELIAQHHERLDGSGFPKQLAGKHISKLAKIVMVADRYDELCNAPDPESSLTPHEALSRLFRHVVHQGELAKYCKQVVQALVQAVGVYPPGSLVELTDGFLGVVSSVNVDNPTKPVVLLYAPWICRNDGLVVNLAKEKTLDINQAVHPKDIPPNVLAYLSPRRMAMFVHATDGNQAFNGKGKRSTMQKKKPLRGLSSGV